MDVTCRICGADSAGKQYCGDRCRKAASRARQREAPVGDELGPTAASVKAELEAGGRLESFRGQAALRLAERIDGSTAVMGFASLVSQLEKTMDAAMAGVRDATSPVDRMRDELAARRAQRSA